MVGLHIAKKKTLATVVKMDPLWKWANFRTKLNRKIFGQIDKAICEKESWHQTCDDQYIL